MSREKFQTNARRFLIAAALFVMRFIQMMAITAVGPYCESVVGAEVAESAAKPSAPTMLKVETPGVSVDSIAFSPDGKLLAGGLSDGNTILWNVGSGQKLSLLTGNGNAIEAASFSIDSTKVATQSPGGLIVVWELRSGRKNFVIDGNPSRNGATFSPDGRFLATKEIADDSIVLWDSNNGAQLRTLRDKKFTSGARWGVRRIRPTIAFSPLGDSVATVFYGKAVVWDTRTGEKLRSFARPNSTVHDVALSADGKLLAMLTTENLVAIIDSESGREISIIKGSESVISSIAFVSSVKGIATGFQDGTTVVSDVHDGRKLFSLSGSRFVSSISTSPDGKKMAVASQGTVAIYNVQAGAEVGTK